jgi:hypothetical protein
MVNLIKMRVRGAGLNICWLCWFSWSRVSKVKILVQFVNAIVFFMFYNEHIYALLYCKGLKPTFGIKAYIGFRGMTLFLRVWLSWVCIKPCFSGSSAVVVLVVK